MSVSEKPWLKHYESGVPATVELPAVPLHRLLEDAARRFPQRPATLFFRASLTYAQLDALCNRFAHAISGLGVKQGDRVALVLPNCPQFLIAYFGAMKAGAVVVAANPLYTAPELHHLLADSGARTAVVLSKFYPAVKEAQTGTPLKRVIVTNIKEYMPVHLRLLFTLLREKKEGHRVALRDSDLVLSHLVAGGPAAPPQVAVGPQDLALLQYTGGTTGVPKGAMISHRALVANTYQMRAWLTDIREGEERILAVLPLFHVYGMVVCMSFAVASGGALILLPQFRSEDTLAAIAHYKPTVFHGVPAMYVAINSNPKVAKFNLSSIRVCVSGAAALPLEVQQTFQRLTGGRLVEGYGLSEAPAANLCNPIYGESRPGSIGLPLPGVAASIRDSETGRELPPGEVGELALGGPQLMEGYWNQPQETALALREGWLYTGDIARMDQDGYFYIVDRKKDMIIVGGFNVYPREVEEALYSHPKVLEAGVVGVKDPQKGEQVKAFVVLKAGEKATAEELLAFCGQRLAKYKVPREVEFRDALPKTLIGKVLRRALREDAPAPGAAP